MPVIGPVGWTLFFPVFGFDFAPLKKAKSFYQKFTLFIPKKMTMETIHKTRKVAVKAPEPSLELKRLQVFVGKWLVEGQNFAAAPVAPNSEFTGVQTYDWFPGNFYLVEKWDRQFNDDENIGIGMFGFNEEVQEFYLTTYDNMGHERIYTIDSYRHIWKFTSRNERGTIVFSSDEQTFIEDWEILKDFNWQPLATLKCTKLK